MLNANRRPLTGSTSPAVISLVLLYSPAKVPEHLLHAWDALEAASREPSKRAANVAYARNRMECARALLDTLRGKKLAAARAELATLEDEIRYAA